MKPYLHAMVPVRQWGGAPDDYLSIHDFIDSSKAAFPDMRHRAILHSSFGCYVVERCFGHTITLSSGKLVSSRDIAEQHILDDMGRIPEVGDYLRGMPKALWAALQGPLEDYMPLIFTEDGQITASRNGDFEISEYSHE